MARVCLVRQHYVPRDSRVARELSELVAAGHEVDVICLRDRHQPTRETQAGVNYLRIPLRHAQGRAVPRYVAEYAAFGLLAAATLAIRQPSRRYDLVQVNSVPDVLIFAAVVPRLFGAAVLLDLQECMPEFLATKFSLHSGHPAVRGLQWLEQLSIRFADHVITPTEFMREVFVERGADARKITVVVDGSDSAVFTPSTPDRGSAAEDRAFTLVSHGTVEEHYGLDTVVRAVAQLRDDLPNLRLVIYGSGSYVPTLRRLVGELGVEDLVRMTDSFVPLPELVRGIAAADAGVVALRRDPFRDLALPGKIFDFILMQKPVIAARSRSVEEMFGSECLELFESCDVADLATAIRNLARDPQRRQRRVRLAQEKAAGLQWSQQRRIYRHVVDQLLNESG